MGCDRSEKGVINTSCPIAEDCEKDKGNKRLTNTLSAVSVRVQQSWVGVWIAGGPAFANHVVCTAICIRQRSRGGDRSRPQKLREHSPGTSGWSIVKTRMTAVSSNVR